MRTFADDRYIGLLRALIEAKNNALPGGLRKIGLSPTDDGDKLKDVDVKAALDAYSCPKVI